MASLRDTLSRTRNSVFSRIQSALGQSDISSETWEDLETLLIQADVGAQTAGTLIERLRARALRECITRSDKLRGVLKEELRARLSVGAPPADYA